MMPPLPGRPGITVNLVATGREGFLYNLSEWGIFKKTIRRWFYRRVVVSLAQNHPERMPEHDVFVTLNGGPPVHVTSLRGDYE